MAGLMQLRRLVSELEPAVVNGHSSVGGAFARAAVWGTPMPVIYTPNGIDLSPDGLDHFDLRKELQLHADVPLVGTVSRLAPQKSPEDFVRICADVSRVQRDVHFILIGAGQLQPEVDEAVRLAGLGDRFHQIPFLPRASLAIQQMDVFVLPSLFEGAAYTPLVAMKAGVPVVLSDVTGNTDTIEHNASGLLFPFGDIESMAGGVLTLLSGGARRDSMVDAAHERVRRHFDRRDMGTRLGHLYEEFSLQHA